MKLRNKSRVPSMVRCGYLGLLGVAGCATLGLNTGGGSTNFNLLVGPAGDF